MPSHEFDPARKDNPTVDDRERRILEEVSFRHDPKSAAAVNLLGRLNFMTMDRVLELRKQEGAGVDVLSALQTFIAWQIEEVICYSTNPDLEPEEQVQEDILNAMRLRYLQRLLPTLLDWGSVEFLSQNTITQVEEVVYPARPKRIRINEPIRDAFEKSPFYTPEREFEGYVDLLSICLTQGDNLCPKTEAFFTEFRRQCRLSQEEFEMLVGRAVSNIVVNSPNRYMSVSAKLERTGITVRRLFPRLPSKAKEGIRKSFGELFSFYFQQRDIVSAERLVSYAIEDGIATADHLLQKLKTDLRSAFITKFRKHGHQDQALPLELGPAERTFLLRYGGEEAIQEWERVARLYHSKEIPERLRKQPALFLRLEEKGYRRSSIEQIVDYISAFGPDEIEGAISVYRLNIPAEAERCDQFKRYAALKASSPDSSPTRLLLAQKILQTSEDGDIFVGFYVVDDFDWKI